MSWRRRLAILVSAIWLAFIGAGLAGDGHEADPLGAFLFLGVMPVAFCWGVAWVWSGFRKRHGGG